jgi:hypothetical protein
MSRSTLRSARPATRPIVPHDEARLDTGMKLITAVLLAASSLRAGDSVSVFDRAWAVPAAADWRISREESGAILHLVHPREPLDGPRRPIQFALTSVPPYDTLTVEADVKPIGKSLIVVFAYQDEAHFDYAHLSIDTGRQAPMHNGIFHVYGGERVRISDPEGPPAFPRNDRWYHAKLTHDAKTGTVAVSVDGQLVPALRAVDMSLGPGKIGLGSFDETAEFRNVRISTR